jgi:uncharacterized membrane protein (UPF0127 family)
MSSKKRNPAPAPPSQKTRRSGTTIAVAGTILLILALIAVLTYHPSNKPMPITNPPPTKQQPDAYQFAKQGELRFFTANQEFITAIDIELAQDEAKRELGLMYRDKLAENQGMLFVFEDEATRSFWMKNTVLPLDMIFVNGRNEIVTIHKNTTPYSEQSYTSTKPAKYVVEVNAGFTARHKISVGDRIAWSQF